MNEAGLALIRPRRRRDRAGPYEAQGPTTAAARFRGEIECSVRSGSPHLDRKAGATTVTRDRATQGLV